MNWTERETTLAFELLNRCASEQEFLDVLGRTKNCAKGRLNRVRYRNSIIRRSPEPAYSKVPARVLEERASSMRVTPASITAALMGDPIPARSALAGRAPA